MAIFGKELTTHYGFSIVDGSYLWTTESENYLDLYGAGASEHTWYFAYGTSLLSWSCWYYVCI